MTQTDPNSLIATLDQKASDAHDSLIALRHHLHQNPELSNREVNTSALIAQRLQAAGLDEVRTGITGHGVVGVLHGKLPGTQVVALRADIDALPVKEQSGVSFASTIIDNDYPGGPFPVAHACGHDCHTAMVVTAAEILASVRDQLPGTVLFVFQPAEEGPPPGENAGAKAMLDAGALLDPKPTMVFGMHVGPLPIDTVGYAQGVLYAASCVVKIVVTGQQVHGSTPWMGIDPMPAAADIISGIGQLYRQVPAPDAVTVTIGHIEDVGRMNIIGQTVTLWGTIRCVEDADMKLIQSKLQRLAENQAAAYGATADVEYMQYVPPLINTQPWLDTVLPSVRRVVGEANVNVIPPFMGYDDVSYFMNAYGGAYLMYGVQDAVLDGENLTPIPGGRGVAMNHSPLFYADDDTLVNALRIYLNVTVDHLNSSETPAITG